MLMPLSMQYGDQRRIHIQLTRNKRRIKRRRKKLKKSKIPLQTRVDSVLTKGVICGYTHPKEVDPFWDVIYRQYEYLIYIDISYRLAVSSPQIVYTDEEIKSIAQDLRNIHEHKQLLLTYMMNFMNIMYGSVIQSRFYGWKYYIDDFVSKFNEVAVLSLRKLKFDVDQTRCSVYFYQAFWLSGLSIINKISDDLKRNHNDDSALNRGTIDMSCTDIDFDSIYEEQGSLAIDMLHTMSDEDTAELVIRKEDKQVHKDVNTAKDEAEYEIFCTLKKLLCQIGVSVDSIYTLSDKKLTKIGKTVRRKLSKGEIVLQEKDKKMLLSMFSSPILRK